MNILLASTTTLLTVESAVSSTNVEIGGGRRFFDGTFPQKTQTFMRLIPDYTVNDNILINITVATNTEVWNVQDAKDLFIEVHIQNRNPLSNSKLFLADLYSEQVVRGGRFGGEAFDQAFMSIGDNQIPFFNESVPYRAHLGLDGCPFSYTNKEGYWRNIEADGLQINLEFQIFVRIPNEQDFYQDYLYIAFDQYFDDVSNEQAEAGVTPGFSFFTVLAIFPILILTLKFKKRK